MLLKVVPVTVIVVALGLSAARRACASVLVVPPIPGMLTVVFEPRRDERRTEAGKQRHTARRFGVRYHALRSYFSWIATRRG